MFRVILLAAILLAAYYAFLQLKQRPPAERKALIWKYAVYGLVLVIIALAATGRLHWLGAVIAVLIPIAKQLGGVALRYLPLQRWLKGASFANPVLNTRFLRITVELATGTMRGEVLEGEYQGQSLDNLSDAEIQELLAHYQQQDPESARLLGAYWQRRGQKNRRQSGNQQSGRQRSGEQQAGANSGFGSLDRREALQILGLPDDAEEKDIVLAHRKLMQKMHPDRGGSDYLAAKINQAKDFLLKT